MTVVEMISLAEFIVRILTPLASRIMTALATDQDVIANLAAESPENIVPEKSHLLDAMQRAVVTEAAAKLRAEMTVPGTYAKLDTLQLAAVNHAIATHDLVVAHAAKV